MPLSATTALPRHIAAERGAASYRHGESFAGDDCDAGGIVARAAAATGAAGSAGYLAYPQNSYRHGVVDGGLEFEHHQDVEPPVAASHPPHPILMTLAKIVADGILGPALQGGEVELLDPLAGEEPGEQVAHHRREREQQLAGGVVGKHGGGLGTRPKCPLPARAVRQRFGRMPCTKTADRRPGARRV